MLRNVLRKVFCHHRLRLASLTFLTALIIASYLLVFLHLESLIQLKESNFLDERSQTVPSLCEEVFSETNAWKEAAATVLSNPENRYFKELLQSHGIKAINPLEKNGLFEEMENLEGGGADQEIPGKRVDGMVNNFQELLGRICEEFTKSREAASYRSKKNAIHDNLPPKSNSNEKKYDIDFVESDALQKLIEELRKIREEVFGYDDWKLKRLKASRRLHLNIHKEVPGSIMPAWKAFQNHISQISLYEDEYPLDAEDQTGPTAFEGRKLVDRLVKDLASLAIISIDEVSGLGTQLKYIFNFEDGSRALFKPMRVPRDSEESLDTYYMYEKERHTSEIAAFHLDRILGFNRVPPAAGRLIDMITDLQVFLGPHSKKKFYLSPVGNQCFFGKCLYYCDPAHGVCGRGSTLEGSFVAFLPNKSLADWSSIKNPWIRSYSKHNRSFWEKDDDGLNICAYVRSQMPFKNLWSLLNVVDIHIFDFLIGNKDRHHFHFFNKFGNNSNFVLIDNGKGFGRFSHDIVDILAPLYQCCKIRYSTLKRLFAFHSNPQERLSQLMKRSLSEDLLPDILTPAHLRALDRRVKIILQKVIKCISQVGDPMKVVFDDDLIQEEPWKTS